MNRKGRTSEIKVTWLPAGRFYGIPVSSPHGHITAGGFVMPDGRLYGVSARLRQCKARLTILFSCLRTFFYHSASLSRDSSASSLCSFPSALGVLAVCGIWSFIVAQVSCRNPITVVVRIAEKNSLSRKERRGPGGDWRAVVCDKRPCVRLWLCVCVVMIVMTLTMVVTKMLYSAVDWWDTGGRCCCQLIVV